MISNRQLRQLRGHLKRFIPCISSGQERVHLKIPGRICIIPWVKASSSFETGKGLRWLGERLQEKRSEEIRNEKRPSH
jgi:hypothetical protein